ncbi:hypothetical protein BaRGS_00006321, partial [Batillaria attramentaria]
MDSESVADDRQQGATASPRNTSREDIPPDQVHPPAGYVTNAGEAGLRTCHVVDSGLQKILAEEVQHRQEFSQKLLRHVNGSVIDSEVVSVPDLMVKLQETDNIVATLLQMCQEMSLVNRRNRAAPCSKRVAESGYQSSEDIRRRAVRFSKTGFPDVWRKMSSDVVNEITEVKDGYGSREEKEATQHSDLRPDGIGTEVRAMWTDVSLKLVKQNGAIDGGSSSADDSDTVRSQGVRQRVGRRRVTTYAVFTEPAQYLTGSPHTLGGSCIFVSCAAERVVLVLGNGRPRLKMVDREIKPAEKLRSPIENNDLLLETEVLSSSESAVHGHLISVFPHYDVTSLAAVVALHSRFFHTRPEDLADACTNFLLDEDDSLLVDFLLPPAVDYFSDFEDCGFTAGDTSGNACAVLSCKLADKPSEASHQSSPAASAVCQPVSRSPLSISILRSSPAKSSPILLSSSSDQRLDKSHCSSPAKDRINQQPVLDTCSNNSSSSERQYGTDLQTSSAGDIHHHPLAAAASDISVLTSLPSRSSSLLLSGISEEECEGGSWSSPAEGATSTSTSSSQLVRATSPSNSPSLTVSQSGMGKEEGEGSGLTSGSPKCNSSGCTVWHCADSVVDSRSENKTGASPLDKLGAGQNNNACVSAAEGLAVTGTVGTDPETFHSGVTDAKVNIEVGTVAPLTRDSLQDKNPSKGSGTRKDGENPLLDIDESSGDTLPDIDILLRKTDSELQVQKGCVGGKISASQGTDDSQHSLSSDMSDLPDLDFIPKNPTNTSCKTEKDETATTSSTNLVFSSAGASAYTQAVGLTALITSQAGNGKKVDTTVTYSSAAQGCAVSSSRTDHKMVKKGAGPAGSGITGKGKGSSLYAGKGAGPAGSGITGKGKGSSLYAGKGAGPAGSGITGKGKGSSLYAGKGKQKWNAALDLHPEEQILPAISAPKRKLDSGPSPTKSNSSPELSVRDGYSSPVVGRLTEDRMHLGYQYQPGPPNLTTAPSIKYLGKGSPKNPYGLYAAQTYSDGAGFTTASGHPVKRSASGSSMTSPLLASHHAAGGSGQSWGTSVRRPDIRSTTAPYSVPGTAGKAFSKESTPADYKKWRSPPPATDKQGAQRPASATDKQGAQRPASATDKQGAQRPASATATHTMGPVDMRSDATKETDRMASMLLASRASYPVLSSIIDRPVHTTRQHYAHDQPTTSKVRGFNSPPTVVKSHHLLPSTSSPPGLSQATTSSGRGLFQPWMLGSYPPLTKSTSHPVSSSSSSGGIFPTPPSCANPVSGSVSSTPAPATSSLATSSQHNNSAPPASSYIRPSLLTATSSTLKQSLPTTFGSSGTSTSGGTRTLNSTQLAKASSAGSSSSQAKAAVAGSCAVAGGPQKAPSEPDRLKPAGMSGTAAPLIHSMTNPAVEPVIEDVEFVIPMEVDEAIAPIVLDDTFDSQGEVEIVDAIPSKSIVIEDDRPWQAPGVGNPGPSTSAGHTHLPQPSTSATPSQQPPGGAAAAGLSAGSSSYQPPGPAFPGLSSGLCGHPGLDIGVRNVLEVLPDASPQYVRDMLEGFLVANGLDYALTRTMETMLDNPAFPRKQAEGLDVTATVHPAPQPQKPQTEPVTVVHVNKPSTPALDSKDYFKDFSGPVNHRTLSQTLDRLSMDFPLLNRTNLSSVMAQFKNHYAPTYRAVEEAMAHFKAECMKRKTEQESKGADGSMKRVKRPDSIAVICRTGESSGCTLNFTLMKRARDKLPCGRKLPDVYEESLQAEINFVARHFQECDRQMAWALLETEYEEQGQMIECSCCFAEHPFENLVQCFDGHLFCCQCLLGYAKEAVYGSGKLNLPCMTEGCDTGFPKSQLIKALPPDMMDKYDERVAEESLNLAAMPDLVRCPKCSIAAVLDPAVKVLMCPNADCRKETCRDCKEDWSEHIGKTCEQLEKKDETKLRTQYEEKMTQAKIRTCPQCKAQFFKEEGCNKMTCRCGATMCYICRKSQAVTSALRAHYGQIRRKTRSEPFRKCKERLRQSGVSM